MKNGILIEGLNPDMNSQDTAVLSLLHGFLQDALDVMLASLDLDYNPDAMVTIDTANGIVLRIEPGKPDRQLTTNQLSPRLISEFGYQNLFSLLASFKGGPTFSKFDLLFDSYNSSVAKLPISGKASNLCDSHILVLLKKWGSQLNKKIYKRVILKFLDQEIELFPNWMGDFKVIQLLIKSQVTMSEHRCKVIGQSTEPKQPWRLESPQEGAIKAMMAPEILREIVEKNQTYGRKDDVLVDLQKSIYKTRDGFCFRPAYTIESITLLNKYSDPQTVLGL